MVHLGISDLPGRELALQIKHRVRLELLQLMVRQFRSVPLKRIRRDLQARGVKVSKQIVESVQGIINEAIVHSWRYSLPGSYGCIHAPSSAIDFRDIAALVKHYWQQSKKFGNAKAVSAAQNIWYTFIKSACIETIAAGLGTSSDCELPRIATGLVSQSPEYQELLNDLLKCLPSSLYVYDPDDVAKFFRHVVDRHSDTFSAIQMAEENLQRSLGGFSRFIDPYYWAGNKT